MNFSKSFFGDKMALCKNNDQAWFSDTLTSAGPLGGRLNPRLSGSDFNATLEVQQMLMYRKTCLIAIVVYRCSGNVVTSIKTCNDKIITK